MVDLLLVFSVRPFWQIITPLCFDFDFPLPAAHYWLPLTPENVNICNRSSDDEGGFLFHFIASVSEPVKKIPVRFYPSSCIIVSLVHFNLCDWSM